MNRRFNLDHSFQYIKFGKQISPSVDTIELRLPKLAILNKMKGFVSDTKNCQKSINLRSQRMWRMSLPRLKGLLHVSQCHSFGNARLTSSPSHPISSSQPSLSSIERYLFRLNPQGRNIERCLERNLFNKPQICQEQYLQLRDREYGRRGHLVTKSSGTIYIPSPSIKTQPNFSS
jgi:hypothetical protein